MRNISICMMFRLLACIAQYQANAYNFINYTCIHAGTLVKYITTHLYIGVP